MPGAPPLQTVEVLGRQAAYWRAGPASARARLLLVHGVGASSHIWEQLAGRLSGELELLAVDLPGSGHTPSGGEANPFGFAGFLDAFLDALSLSHVDAALGHSMGGTVVLEHALLSPGRARGLMIFNSAPTLPRLARLALRTPGVGALLALPDKAPPLRSTLFTKLYLRTIFGDADKLTQEVLEGYTRLAGAPDFYTNMAEHLAGFAKHKRRTADLAAIVVPASVVWGERDPLFPLSIGRKLAETLPRASLQRLPRVGHCPPQEVPELVEGLVRELLSRVGREAPAPAPA